MKIKRVIGIDPGLTCTAFFIVDICINDNIKNNVFTGNKLIDYGCIKPKVIKKRLLEIFNFIEYAIIKYKPEIMILETSYVNMNPATSISCGYARAMCKLCAEQYELELFELAPSTIKKNIAGHGHATKEQVANTLRIFGTYNEHITDALAICLNYKFLS